MKKRITLFLLAALMLTACGKKNPMDAPAVPSEQPQAVQTTEAETQAAPEYPGMYGRTWSEEIAGTVVEMHAYIVLNEDHTGFWIAQDVGTLTWDENRLMLTVGAVYSMTLAQEDGTGNLLVSEFRDENGAEILTEYERIEKLPAEIEEMLVGF